MDGGTIRRHYHVWGISNKRPEDGSERQAMLHRGILVSRLGFYLISCLVVKS